MYGTISKEFSPRFATRRVTVRQIIAAIGNNGYPQSKGNLFTTEKDGTPLACAMGQGALNLGLDENGVDKALGELGIRSKIVMANDSEGLSCERIALRLQLSLTEAQKNQSVTIARKNWASRTKGYRGVTVPRGAVQARGN